MLIRRNETGSNKATVSSRRFDSKLSCCAVEALANETDPLLAAISVTVLCSLKGKLITQESAPVTHSHAATQDLDSP